jgi:hypothetical protein
MTKKFVIKVAWLVDGNGTKHKLQSRDISEIGNTLIDENGIVGGNGNVPIFKSNYEVLIDELLNNK